jgi:nucleotide-binding universal stress UspA family protein
MTTHKILCALDFSSGSRPALQMAIRLAHERHAELVVMHVWYVPQTGLGDLPFPRGIAERIAGEAMQSLDAAVAEARAAGLTAATCQLVQGVPGWMIVDAVNRDRAIDLVVVGTHGRTGLARALIGSVAEYVVRHAPCAVLVARQDRDDRTSDQRAAETTSVTRSCCDS